MSIEKPESSKEEIKRLEKLFEEKPAKEKEEEKKEEEAEAVEETKEMLERMGLLETAKDKKNKSENGK